jgi:hypothetical protein
MPVQTTSTDYVYIPDGAKVEIDGGAGFVDLGAFNSDVTATLNYEINEILSSNASIIKRVGKKMKMAWAGTLINLNPTGVALFSAGLLTTVATAASAVTDSDDQTIAISWVDMSSIAMAATDGAAGAALRFSAAPTLTSVTASSSGVLADNDDYFIQVDPNSFSGYSILLNTAGTATVATSESVVIVYASVTPIAKTTLYGGASTFEFSSYAMRITHTDDDSLVRRLNLPSVTPDSGGFQFNFKSSESDGSEEMPITCTADLDTSLTNGQQLFSWEVDTGAS